MQLDQMSAVIRRRTAWEGVDLGFAMARQWFLPLWGLWWLTALPVALLAAALLHGSPAWASVLVWWLKPGYEPLLLFWLSRRLFGEELSWREALAEWRRVLRPQLLANLTWRRFSPSRSFAMPVSHLEGLKGRERSKRFQVLSGSQSAGSWLTIAGAHFEFAIEFSILTLAFYLVPDELLRDNLWTLLRDTPPAFLWVADGVWLFAMSLFAPFYVAGGFALYLTRRSELEAWDLELAFRRMAPRFRSASVAGLLLAVLAVAGLCLPAPRAFALDQCDAPLESATAQQPAELPGNGATLDAMRARQAIDEVLGSKDFGETRTVSYWKYIGKTKPDDEKPASRFNFGWVRYLAEFLEYLLWVAAAVALGWLLLYLLRMLDWLPQRPGRRSSPTVPTMLFGMPVTPESLPEDVRGAVRALLDEGRLRAALSLLYRATLVQLIHAHHIRIPDSATEGECQRIVLRERPADESDFFGRLTRAWVWCAYGHRAPAATEVAEFADRWTALYGGKSDE